jgi:hypothetical protein
MCCRGMCKQAGGYIWKFTNLSDLPDPNAEPRRRGGSSLTHSVSSKAKAKDLSQPSSSRRNAVGGANYRSGVSHLPRKDNRTEKRTTSNGFGPRDKSYAKLSSLSDWQDVNWTHCLCRARWKTPKSLFHICLEAVWVRSVMIVATTDADVAKIASVCSVC